jgi:anti-sigma regulatory factor (Ser/Thr protein kinase)
VLIEQVAPADMAHLRALLEAVDRVCQAAGADRAFHADLKLAVEEALVNVIQHGHAGHPSGELRLALRWGPWEGRDAIRAEIQDHGAPFNPLQATAPDITAAAEDRPIGGLGILLMRQLTDAQAWRHDAVRGNQLTLVKFLAAAPAA